VQRAIAGTLLFALGATLVAAVASWVAYERVRVTFEREFERRLELVALAVASQVAADDVTQVQAAGQQADAYGNLMELFLSLRQAGGVADVALLDTSGIVLADLHEPRREGKRSGLAAEAARALASARPGGATTTGSYRVAERERRAALAPVAGSTEGARPAALVAVESELTYAATLAELSRTLALVALVTLGALALLATLFVRMALSAARLERRLTRAQNLAAMGQMTATLAHEIRNPLGIIRNAATRLGQLDAEARRMADFVVEETDRLNRTLNRYLEFARGTEHATGAGDAREALRATLDLLEGEMHSRGIALEKAGADQGRAPVRLENESLKQIYLNLILNALEAMPAGGVLRVSVAERRGRYEIALADTGAGMRAEVLRRAGEPFYTTKAQGSGLGLVLTRRLLRSAGGDLRVESEEGRGTTCTVVLPARSE
jgi:signal transduction histidine kinase